jgi:hypothetical protein
MLDFLVKLHGQEFLELLGDLAIREIADSLGRMDSEEIRVHQALLMDRCRATMAITVCQGRMVFLE